MGLHVKCRGCKKPFTADNITNIGRLWQPVFVAVCPTCGAQNRSVVGGGRLDVDDVISKVVEGKYGAKKKKTPVAERVRCFRHSLLSSRPHVILKKGFVNDF